MTTTQVNTARAIQAASKGNWEEAKLSNEEIIQLEPTNIGALNRLAFCEMQLENTKRAKQLYEEVLTIERFNPIATKYLALLKHKVKPQRLTQVTSTQDFIEEPGKTRSVHLQKLADPEVLQATPTAMRCKLVVKNHRVNVVTESGIYLGSLPDDIAFRLQKLIIAGNTYSVLVQSTTKKSCTVFIKEQTKSKECSFTTSFPIVSGNRMGSEDVLLDEAPLDTRETGNESEEHEFEEADPTE